MRVFTQVASNIKGFAWKFVRKSAYASCVNGPRETDFWDPIEVANSSEGRKLEATPQVWMPCGFSPQICRQNGLQGWVCLRHFLGDIIYSSNDPGSPPNSLFPYILPHTAMPTIHLSWPSTFAPTLTPRPNLPHHLTPGSPQSNITWHPALDKTRLTACMLYHNKPRQRYSLAFLLLLTSQKNRTLAYNNAKRKTKCDVNSKVIANSPRQMRSVWLDPHGEWMPRFFFFAHWQLWTGWSQCDKKDSRFLVLHQERENRWNCLCVSHCLRENLGVGWGGGCKIDRWHCNVEKRNQKTKMYQ